MRLVLADPDRWKHGSGGGCEGSGVQGESGVHGGRLGLRWEGESISRQGVGQPGVVLVAQLGRENSFALLLSVDFHFIYFLFVFTYYLSLFSFINYCNRS